LPKAAVAYARGLMTSRDHAAAEKLLRETIDDSRDPAAIRLYGEVNPPDPLVALDRAEAWLRAAPEDPDLLLTCARLCLRSELIGKARSYLEAGLARRQNPEASLLLADLLESIDDPARASAVLREAVARSAGRRSPLLQRTRLKRY
jgi:HemY protein